MDETVMELLGKILEGQTVLREELIQEITGLSTKVDRLEMRIENEVIAKVRGLYDSREAQSEINKDILSALSRIGAKLEVLQFERAHIRRI